MGFPSPLVKIENNTPHIFKLALARDQPRIEIGALEETREGRRQLTKTPWEGKTMNCSATSCEVRIKV